MISLRTRATAPLALITALTLLAANAAHAHSVWIEPNAEGGLVVRFAEPDGKFEKSPGHLDSLSAPLAVTFRTNDVPEVIDAPKKADHFALPGASALNPASLETSFIVMGAPGRPGRRPIFYARWHPAGQPAPVASLNLDLVPTGKPGEVRVVFRRQPLANVEAILRTPDEREQSIRADGDGLLRFPIDQSGLYLLRVARHREPIAGYHLGQEYKQTSHNASLAWVQP